MFKNRKFLAALLIVSASLWPSQANALTIPESFIKYAQSPILAEPGILLVDPVTSETVYQSAPDNLRAPASVMKLLSATLVSTVLDLNTTFNTTISRTSEPGRFTLLGEFDPWLTLSSYEAQKYKAALLPSLINKAVRESAGAKRIVIDYYGLHDTDVQALKKFFKKRVYLSMNKFPTADSVRNKSVETVGTISSPNISEILKFTLLWSDNTKADRLARFAARSLGYTPDAFGIQQAMENIFPSLGISTSGLQVYDGAGLAKFNKVSVRTVAQLLVRIKSDPKYAAIKEGLPVAGESGTLRNRYKEVAQSAAGLVRAKTGWINGTVSLAGYVNVGEQEYVFVVIADRIQPSEPRRKAARETIDKMLATIARPVQAP